MKNIRKERKEREKMDEKLMTDNESFTSGDNY